MNLDKLLSLNNDEISLKYIDNMLENTDIKDERYFTLAYKKANILNFFRKTNEAIYFLKEVLEEQLSEYTIDLYTFLIHLLLQKDQVDEALSYINIKRKILNVNDYVSYFLDMLKYQDKINDRKKAHKLIKEILDSNITLDETIYCYTLLTKYAFREKRETEYQTNLDKLTTLYENQSDKTGLYELLITRIEFDYNQEDYIKVSNEANKLLKEKLVNEQRIQLATILIKTYIKLSNYKAASKVEASCEKILDSASENLQLEFCKNAYEIYQVTNNSAMAGFYHDKINKIMGSDILKEGDEEFKENLFEFDDQQVFEDQIIKDKSTNILVTKKSLKPVFVSQMYEKVNKIITHINKLELTMFREIFRITGIHLTKEISIDEIVVFYRLKNSFKGFHYKVQRVYDKGFDIKDLSNTINYKTFLDNEEKYVDNLSTSDLNKNIITKKIIDTDITCYSIPLHNNQIVFGSISYLSKKRFIDREFSYEILNIINELLNNYLNFFLEKEEINLKNQKLVFITDSMSSGIKEFSDGYIILNHKAQEILGLPENVYEKDFIQIIDPLELSTYMQAKRNLLSGEETSVEIEYHIIKNLNRIRLKERMHLNFSHNKISIFSLIDNIDKVRVKEEALTRLAFTNYVSKLSSGVKLHKDLKGVINTKKFALAVVNTNNFNKFNELYGLEFANNLLYYIAKTLDDIISRLNNINLYHIESDKFALLYLTSNDKRFLESNTLKILNTLLDKLKQIDDRYKVTFSCGIFRSSTTYKSNDIEKIMSNANDALFEAKSDNKSDNSIVIYHPNQTKERFFNTQLVNHITDAIKANLIAIDYNSVINLTNGDVHMYEVSVSITNYDVNLDVFNNMLEQKNIKYQLFKYVINKVMLELSGFYHHTNNYFKVIIPIYSSLLVDEEFINYFIGQKIFHNIAAKEVITLRIIPDMELDIKQAKRIKRLEVNIGSDNLNNYLLDINDVFFFDVFNYQKNSVRLLNLIANKEEIIFYNVDDEALLNLCLANSIQYAKGRYFNKKMNISDIINLVK